jgi:hypothetical protein
MAVRHRTFADRGLQKTYDTYRAERPDPEAIRSRDGLGHAYFVGRTVPLGKGRHRRIPFVVGSLCYAAWAAGLDIAREETAKNAT